MRVAEIYLSGAMKEPEGQGPAGLAGLAVDRRAQQQEAALPLASPLEGFGRVRRLV